MPGLQDNLIIGSVNPVEGKVVSLPTHEAANEKIRLEADDVETKKDVLDAEVKAALPLSDGEPDDGAEDVIIITGADAATHLLPLRDDGEPALTFRSLFLATGLSCFQAIMSQIYTVGHRP